MRLPLQITFRGLAPSPAIRRRVREEAEHLERLFPRIVSCRAVVKAPHRHLRRGNQFGGSAGLRVPRGEIAATRDPPPCRARRDVHVAIRDAFQAVSRRPQDTAWRQRGEVKRHQRSSDAAYRSGDARSDG